MPSRAAVGMADILMGNTDLHPPPIIGIMARFSEQLIASLVEMMVVWTMARTRHPTSRPRQTLPPTSRRPQQPGERWATDLPPPDWELI